MAAARGQPPALAWSLPRPGAEFNVAEPTLANPPQSCRAPATTTSLPRLLYPPAPVPTGDKTIIETNRTRALVTSSSIGLVLSGGGVFGAWETGALYAFFEWWKATRREEPPIRVAVGTSTGALISPFALLGRTAAHNYLAEVINLYATVKNKDIRREDPGLLLPAFRFLFRVPAVYDGGYRKKPAQAELLYKLLLSRLSADRIAMLGDLWSQNRRLGVATLDFSTGRRHLVTNRPSHLGILVKAIMASAVAPLALPPVPLPGQTGAPAPHMDGGLYEEAPVRTLFEVAAMRPKIALTHVVVVSSFPWFPSDDGDPVQAKVFPVNPKFGSIGDRMNALMSEASATKDTRLAWAAIELRKDGRSEKAVHRITGHRVGPPPTMIRLFPKRRLGWQAFEFVVADMKKMQKRGCTEAAEILGATVDCSVFPTRVSRRRSRRKRRGKAKAVLARPRRQRR